MEHNDRKLVLRPGITNPRLWYPKRPPDSEWKRIRKIVMERDNWTCVCCAHRALKWMNAHHVAESSDHSPNNLVPVCVACHAVLHIGRSLVEQIVEVWKCEISQVEVVQRTREGIRQGLSLAEIKKELPLSSGPYLPQSVAYANDLIDKIGDESRD